MRSHFFIVYSIISVPVDVQCFASGKGINDSLGFWIPHCGFRIPGTLFQYLSVELGFWIPIVSGIPDFVSCIPDSKSKILPDSGFPYMWGEMSDFLSLSNHKDNVSGKKLPPKTLSRSLSLALFVKCWRFFLQFSSQDFLPVPNCLVSVFTFSIQRCRRKFYVVAV